ncbi:MAG: nitroreductase family protein [Synergistaceae bacterium]|nr:nitroreductase family protein [Synergistaceae bacterium]
MTCELDAIMRRRTIRRFTNEFVHEADMDKILAAALAAPSAHNRHPLRLIVLNTADMARIAEEIEQKTPFEQGQWAIAACADTRGYDQGLAWIEDCAAAMENMLIAAESMGLGAMWYGVYARPAKEPQIRKFLALPGGVEVLGIAIVGHKAEDKPPTTETDREHIHYGGWKE